jgi:hypothetical protein
MGWIAQQRDEIGEQPPIVLRKETRKRVAPFMILPRWIPATLHHNTPPLPPIHTNPSTPTSKLGAKEAELVSKTAVSSDFDLTDRSLA